jgi:undecaprenyl-diphosphatase
MNKVGDRTISEANGSSRCLSVSAPGQFTHSFAPLSPRFWLTCAVWMAAVILTMVALDEVTAGWVSRTIPVARIMWLFNIMKAPGNFIFTLVISALLVTWHANRWRAAAFVCGSGVLSGLLCSIIKWMVGRTRPFHNVPAFRFQPFRYGVIGLFHGENLSFPSGHTCLAFSTASALSILIPRWRVVFFTGGTIVAVERVLQGSHYAGDVVAAAGLGVLSTYLASWIIGLMTPDGKLHEETWKVQ